MTGFSIAFAVALMAVPPEASGADSRAAALGEVEAVVRSMVDAAQALDVDAATKDVVDAPDTLVLTSDGSFVDVKTLREGVRAFYASQASLRFTPIRVESRLLGPDLALYAWSYRVDGVSKKGTRWHIESEAASDLLRKVNGAWRFVFFHESSGPAKASQATKP